MARLERKHASAVWVNAAMLAYMVWLVLPAVQTATHAVTGALTVAVFGVGVLLDGETLPRRWASFLPRVLLAAALPLALFYFLERGGGNLPGYYAQQGMFWFPLLWCAYARERDDARLYRWIGPVLMALWAVTTLTTLGWLIQGMLRGGKVYAYSRSLGFGEPGREAYLRELMLRNIGGYDFIYASVLSLPVTAWLITRARGWKRAGITAFYAVQLLMIGLSQYTYALLFATAVTGVELLGALLRAARKKLSVTASFAWTVPLFAALWLLRIPLITWAGQVAAGIGFENVTVSLNQLLLMLSGGTVEDGSRLTAYQTALHGFAASPLIGSMGSGTKFLGMHSDLLDMLSGMGLVGTAGFALSAWAIGRGAGKGLGRTAAMPHLWLQYLLFTLCILLGTVFYSREIPLVMCMSAALILREAPRAA